MKSDRWYVGTLVALVVVLGALSITGWGLFLNLHWQQMAARQQADEYLDYARRTRETFEQMAEKNIRETQRLRRQMEEQDAKEARKGKD